MKPRIHSIIADFFKSTSASFPSLIEQYGSPLHIVFPELFFLNIQNYRQVFKKHQLNEHIFFAAKANKSVAFLQAAAHAGINVEVSSMGELQLALAQGVKGPTLLFSGPLKSNQALWIALQHQCLISVDDLDELRRLGKLADQLKKNQTVSILIRINDVADQVSRFGISRSELAEVITQTHASKVQIMGCAFHINNYKISDRARAIIQVLPIVKKLRQAGHPVSIIDLGGGMTIPYTDKTSWQKFLKDRQQKKQPSSWSGRVFDSFYPYYSDYPKEQFLEELLQQKTLNGVTIIELLKENQLSLFIEPGRSLLDQAGITLMEVSHIKEVAKHNLVIVKGNINHLSEQWFNTDFIIDPILISINKKKSQTAWQGSIAGNLCLENDILRWLPTKLPSKPKSGDYLAFINTAGYQMDSNESSFHHIPIPTKIVFFQSGEEWVICQEHSYLESLLRRK